ncbi:hypothetical protein [Streptomyces sp. NPDC050388]|uniref:hypothetical protein n=1 Tax=Streptomyces sp. NPDC050388 TaxID=3155781 RepID=UPI00342E3444
MHSLEMGRAEVSNRILSARARVAFHHIRDGVDGLTQDDWDRLDRHAPELRGLPSQPAGLSMSNSRSRWRGPQGTSAPSVISRCGTLSRPTAGHGVREGRSQVFVVCSVRK